MPAKTALTLPTANPDAVTVCGPATVVIDVLANDLPGTTPIQRIYQIFDSSGNAGTLAVSPDSLSVIYTVAFAFSGTDLFTYQIQDQSGIVSAPATITVTGSCGSGSAVTANDDCAETSPGSPVTISVLQNDFAGSGTLSIASATIVSGGGAANLSINAGETLTYTPPAGFTGLAQIQYTATNGTATDVATLSIYVTSGVNNPPVFPDVYLCSNPIQPVVICLSETDSDGDPITITQVNSLFDCGITIQNNHCIQYVALPAFFGVDTLTLTVCDQHYSNPCNPVGTPGSLCATVNVIITVPCPNAQNDVVFTPINTPIVVNVTTNDAGVPPLTVQIITPPVNGTATLTDNNVAYTPNIGFTGTDTITYQITDPNGNTDTALVIVHVVPNTELPPIAVDDLIACPFSVEPNGTISPVSLLLNVLSNDTDPNGNLAGIVAVGTPLYGTATIVLGGNNILYAPSSAYLLGSVTEQFFYVVSDAAGLTDTAFVTITCNLTQTAPCIVAVNDAQVLPSGSAITINVLANDLYCANCTSATVSTCQPLSIIPPITGISISNPPAHGTVAVVNNGTEDVAITYTPNPGYSGPDVLQYTVCLPDGTCGTATVTITVIPPATEQSITANNDFATTTAGTPVIIQVLNNDQLCLPPLPCLPPLNTGQILSITILTPPANGVATVNTFLGSSISVTYTPNNGFTGTNTFQYIVCSVAQSLCDTATVTISVTGSGGNNPPVANNDFVATAINSPLPIFALANDFDPDGDPITITAISVQPQNGSAVINPDGNITYTPNFNFVGVDTLTYVISDGSLTDDALVIIFVEGAPINQPPVANNDFATTPLNTPVTIPVLANDTDPDGDSISIVGIDTQPANGFVFINPGGTITYNPNPGFTGIDSFAYQITDGQLTDIAWVVVSIEEDVNEAPIANDDTASTTPDTPVAIPVLDNDTDPDGDALTVVDIPNPPANGTATINPDSTITYTPNPGFIGTDTFTYVISDGEFTDTAQVVVSIEEDVNEAPIANDDTASTTPDTPVAIPVLDNDTDPDGDALTVVDIPNPPANGTATINPDSTITYTPNPGFIGTDTFTYVISDGEFTDTAQVVVSIEEDVNEAPIANDDTASTTPDTPVAIPVLDNDTDPDGDALTVV
ncbi:MAG TPA: Ig-like domain-containing protein, partial [Chitinophagales bacterium]|nr:Ig-like domain-containing protein [Chitinophagales bacterium]